MTNSEKSRSHQAWVSKLGISGLLAGQTFFRLLQGRIHRPICVDQLAYIGFNSLTAVLLINFFAGMIFTVQTARELTRFGAVQTVGGAFAIAFCRELAPVLTAGILAGQVGSAFASELAVMKVTEQIDALKMLRTDPVDYLVIPRMVACCLMVPILTTFGIGVGIVGGAMIAAVIYGLPMATFLESVRDFLIIQDLVAVALKSFVFGILLASIGCGWGLTTVGGAKEVGQSATDAVVSIWIALFVADFFLSLVLFGPLKT